MKCLKAHITLDDANGSITLHCQLHLSILTSSSIFCFSNTSQLPTITRMQLVISNAGYCIITLIPQLAESFYIYISN